MPDTFNDSSVPSTLLGARHVTRRTPEDIKLQLATVWKQSEPIILDRLQHLDAFVTALATGTSTPEQHEDAITIAHTFAGSLGMFGYTAGTDVARAMEQLLTSTDSPNPETIRDYVAKIHAMLGL
jgi:hypothetical protein